MKRDELDALAAEGGGLGCEPFGHLASPFVDGELPDSELARFDTHLPGCEPCKRLVGEYRALDALASPEIPGVAESDWDAAFARVREAIDEERSQAEADPLAPLVKAAERFEKQPSPRWLRPALYLAASLALAAVLIGVQRANDPATTPGSVQVASAAPELECREPDYVPVAYTIGDGDDVVSVMYCAFVGADT